MLIQEKIQAAKKLLREFDIDCWITFVRESQINGDPNLAFLTTADVTWHSAFIITPDSSYAVVGRYDKITVEDTGAYNEVIGFVEGFKNPFLKIMKQLNPKNIALNFSEGSEICDGITHGMYLTLSKTLAEISFDKRIISAEKIVSALRERKSSTEISHIKEAIRHTEEIFILVSHFIKPGISEKEIARFMKDEVKKRNLGFAWEETVCPAIFTGPETAEAHYAPTDKKVERGHILNMDFGVKFNGYCSDLQRTFYILKENEKKAPDDVMKGFNTIVEAVEKPKLAMKPDVLATKIDKISRDIVTRNGYEEFPHALGHQVGRFSHDGTVLLGPPWEKYLDKINLPLKENMVFTIEPRLPIAGHGIATIEEMVLITETGAEWLSHPQKELILIE